MVAYTVKVYVLLASAPLKVQVVAAGVPVETQLPPPPLPSTGRIPGGLTFTPDTLYEVMFVPEEPPEPSLAGGIHETTMVFVPATSAATTFRGAEG